MGLKQKLHTLKEKYKGTKMAPAFNAFHTFLYSPAMMAEDSRTQKTGEDEDS